MNQPHSPDSPSHETAVLFVCLGNICRSPLAEGVLRSLLEVRGLQDRVLVESAGTAGYHVGEAPDPRSSEVALRRGGISLSSRGRRVERGDLDRFDWILAMDDSNHAALERLGAGTRGRARLALLREYDPEAEDGDREVPDPYYGGTDGFDRVYEMVERSCARFIEEELAGR